MDYNKLHEALAEWDYHTAKKTEDGFDAHGDITDENGDWDFYVQHKFDFENNDTPYTRVKVHKLDTKVQGKTLLEVTHFNEDTNKAERTCLVEDDMYSLAAIILYG
jgi:hypothetical protein